MIKEKFDLSGKNALVVGGRGFLGRRFCAALAEFGAKVYSSDLPEPSLAAARDHSTIATDQTIEQFNCDVTDPESVRQMIEQVSAAATRIDVLVYSVTAKPKDFYVPFTECSLEGWQLVLRAELDGLFLIAQSAGKIMERAGAGSMIFLSSIYGIVGNDQHIYEGSNLRELYLGDTSETKQVYAHPVYAAAKGAVISLTRFLAAYWGDYNIRVNCIEALFRARSARTQRRARRRERRGRLSRL
jgi:NAD(P)-dependent dehydrogenase (short-subunit alcohol dehydrogenase family)